MAGNLELIKKLREASGAGISACQKALKECGDDYDKAFDFLRKQGISKASSKADRATSEGLCCVATNANGIAVVKLSCETDFVAKNEKFQALVNNLTQAALNGKISSVDGLLSADVNGQKGKDAIAEGIASIGENIVLSQVVYHDLASGQSAHFYVHNKVEGKDNMGTIVSAIVAAGCDSDDAKLLVKQVNMHIAAMSPLALSEESISADVIAREKAIYEEQVAQLNKPAEIAAKMVDGKLRKFFEESVLTKQAFILDNKSTVGEVLAKFNKDNGANLKIVSFDRVSIK